MNTIKIAGRNVSVSKKVITIVKSYNKNNKLKSVYTDVDNEVENVENIINFEVKNADKANKYINNFIEKGYVKFPLERDSSGNIYRNKVVMELYLVF